MRPLSILISCLCLSVLPACQAHPAAPDVEGPLISEQARVVEVDPLLGQVLLDMGGRQVWGYWQTEAALAAGGTVSRNGPMGTTVGDYKPATVRDVPFPARAGDTIAFIGMKTGDEILLRRVTVLSH